MSQLVEDPFLCNECQKLGYCKLRAWQAEEARKREREFEQKRQHLAWQEAQLAPIPPIGNEPVPSLREFVAEHRPDLTKHLPRTADTAAMDKMAKRPTLAEIQASIAARKQTSTLEAADMEQSALPKQEPLTQQKNPSEAQPVIANVPTSSNKHISLSTKKRNKTDLRLKSPGLSSRLFRVAEQPAKNQQSDPTLCSHPLSKEKKTFIPG